MLVNADGCANADGCVKFPRQQVHQSHVQHESGQPPHSLAPPQVDRPAVDVVLGLCVPGVARVSEVAKGQGEGMTDLEANETKVLKKNGSEGRGCIG